MSQHTARLVARLREFDSSTISDACERAGHEYFVVTGISPLTGANTIAGAAITVQLGQTESDSEGSRQHLGTAAIEAANNDNVIIVDHQGRSDCAGWGGNLSRGAMERGCVGTVIDGAARDIDEAADLGYSVFARSATPRTARGRTIELACQTPIQFAGVPINPGDYVIADSTGIVIIPQQAADDVIEAATAIAANEVLIANQIDSGTPITEAMGRTYEEFLT